MFVSMQFLLPRIVGGSQHTVSQRCALVSSGMQQVQADILKVTLNFLQLTQHHTPLLLNLCLIQRAILHHLRQQLHSLENIRKMFVKTHTFCQETVKIFLAPYQTKKWTFLHLVCKHVNYFIHKQLHLTTKNFKNRVIFKTLG